MQRLRRHSIRFWDSVEGFRMPSSKLGCPVSLFLRTNTPIEFQGSPDTQPRFGEAIVAESPMQC